MNKEEILKRLIVLASDVSTLNRVYTLSQSQYEELRQLQKEAMAYLGECPPKPGVLRHKGMMMPGDLQEKAPAKVVAGTGLTGSSPSIEAGSGETSTALPQVTTSALRRRRILYRWANPQEDMWGPDEPDYRRLG